MHYYDSVAYSSRLLKYDKTPTVFFGPQGLYVSVAHAGRNTIAEEELPYSASVDEALPAVLHHHEDVSGKQVLASLGGLPTHRDLR